MKIFVTGTDTDVGKTFISTWLCVHSGYGYYKPIQTGIIESSDSLEVRKLSNNVITIYDECYIYKAPVSPHLAALLENDRIDIDKISLPDVTDLIIEGAGGLLVPLNKEYFMIDLIKKFNTSVILVSKNILGTINHTILSLEALRSRNINILGVIMNGNENRDNVDAIEYYGKVKILACMPTLQEVNYTSLMNIPFPEALKKYFK